MNSMTSIEKTITESLKAFHIFKYSPKELRAALLLRLADEMESQKKRFTDSIIREVFKPITLAEAEVNRAITTLKISAAEISALESQIIESNNFNQGGDFESATIHRVPRGPVLAIGPFNFPLNLMIHKIAPALASGSSVIAKPPLQATTATRLVCEIFQKISRELDPEEKYIPTATLQMITPSNEEIGILIKDQRLPTVSFTGSAKVGWSLPLEAPQKKIILELGGNASVIVTESSNLDIAASRCAFGAFAYAGQICISVQRILIERKIYSQFVEKFIRAAKEFQFGDLYERKTLTNKMINPLAAEKLESWIHSAEKKGARSLLPWTRDEQFISPVILENVDHSESLWCEEAFGPVVVLEAYDSLSDAIEIINESSYAIHTSIFSKDEKEIQTTIAHLDTAGLLINEIPTVRLDHLPYGGIKKSGLGREGPRYAIEEFSELKVILRKKI